MNSIFRQGTDIGCIGSIEQNRVNYGTAILFYPPAAL